MPDEQVGCLLVLHTRILPAETFPVGGTAWCVLVAHPDSGLHLSDVHRAPERAESIAASFAGADLPVAVVGVAIGRWDQLRGPPWPIDQVRAPQLSRQLRLHHPTWHAVVVAVSGRCLIATLACHQPAAIQLGELYARHRLHPEIVPLGVAPCH